jgi:FkbM family methyltransferase
MHLDNLSMEDVRKLFQASEISREDYWLYLQSKLSVLDDIKESLFQAIKSINMNKDDLTLNFNFYEDYLIKLIIDFHDIRSAANTIFANGEYETTQMRIICQLAKQNDYFMDIGSNVGLYAICAWLVNPNIKVASFEPNVEIAKQQKRNLEINNVDSDSVRIFNFGLANEDSNLVNFFVPNFTGSGGGGLLNLHPEEGPSKSSQVAIKILDNLEKDIRSHVDFIKVDIEGAEFEFLKGALKTISDSKPVIISELLRKWMLPFGSQPQDFVETLLEMGYVCFEIEDLGIKRTTEINELTIGNNFVFVHKNDIKNLRIITDFENGS